MRMVRFGVVLGLLAAVFPLKAQTTVSIAGGTAIPMGGQTSAFKMGYSASLAIASKPPLAPVGIRFEGALNSFSLKDAGAGHGEQRILAFTANATFSRAHVSLRSPYLIGGLGLYNTRLTGSSEPNNDVGFNVGLGLNLTTAVSTFLEARYHHVPSEGGAFTFIPVTLGVRF